MSRLGDKVLLSLIEMQQPRKNKLDKFMTKSLLEKLQKDSEKKDEKKGKWTIEEKILLGVCMTLVGPIVGMTWWLVIRQLASAVAHP